jgi:soluble lytic murein transglycosylase-like protein
MTPAIRRVPRRALLVLLALFGAAAPARADLVYFENGRTMSVKGSRVEGEVLIVTLRSGGEIAFDRQLITHIEEDEVPYPEPEPADDAPSDPGGLDGGMSQVQAGLSLSRYEPIIQRVSAAHGVDPTLVRAVIEVESKYRPGARSPKGALGLMQVMPATARRYGITNLLDPASNIEAGISHLRSLLDRFPLAWALAAYNAGELAVQRFSGIPPYPETRNYVSRILKLVEP